MPKIILFGLGSIGSEIARLVLERGMEIAGAVDADPEKAGRDLGELLGQKALGIRISPSLDEVLSSDADIVVNSTISSLEGLEPDIAKAIRAGKNFISTCEELAYPRARHPEIAERIDRLARENGVTVMGTGVNPGFVMDRLVLTLAGACRDIKSIRAIRIVNTTERRLPLQKKTGAGMTPQEFRESHRKGMIRHVGLPESLRMIADGLGIGLDETREETEPVIADRDVSSRHIKAGKGVVAGLRQTALGIRKGEPLITLELQMHLGADACDSIRIDGTPGIDMRINGGIHGDLATVGIVVNSIPRVIDARPGLLTVKDLA
jgi:hypothetical protein